MPLRMFLARRCKKSVEEWITEQDIKSYDSFLQRIKEEDLELDLGIDYRLYFISPTTVTKTEETTAIKAKPGRPATPKKPASVEVVEESPETPSVPGSTTTE